MDTYALIALERRRLADELDSLTDADWRTPSLCEGWTAHTVAAHLTMPWAVGKLAFVGAMLKAKGDIAKAMDAESRKLAGTKSPQQCVAGLRDNAENRFVPPTMPPEAPLSDAVLHGADILRPLGRSVAVDATALTKVLDFLVSDKATRAFRSAKIDGLRFEATDVDWSHGPADGAAVAGPALSIAGLLVGRRVYADDLTGAGVARLAA